MDCVVTSEKRPLFAGGLTALAVIAAVMGLPLWVAVALTIVAAVLLWYTRRMVCAVIALLFLLIGVGFTHRYIRPTQALEGQTDHLSGVVIATEADNTMCLIRVTASDYLPVGSRVMLQRSDDQWAVLYDTVTATVRLSAIEDNQHSYVSAGAFAVAFPDHQQEEYLTVTGHIAAPLSRALQRLRTTLTGTSRRVLSSRESGVLVAICFGERAFLDAATLAHFRGSGLSHLLVVSGLHLSMVALAVQTLLRRMGRCVGDLLTLVTTWLFALFAGASPSVLRAAVMCSIWLVGRLLFCRSDGLNALGLAAMVLLAAEPYAILDISFQLSFAATLGVLLLSRRLLPLRTETDYDAPLWVRWWQECKCAIRMAGVACLAAVLFTFPISAYRFGGVSLATLPANLLAVPAAGLTMMMGWLGAIVGLVPFLGWLSNAFLLVSGLLIRYMGGVASLLSHPWTWLSTVHWWQWLLLCGVCALLIVGLLRRVSPARVVTSVTALMLLTLCVGLPLTDAVPQLTIVPSDNEGGVVIAQGRHTALLLTHVDELDEVVYLAPPIDPDVIFVGYGTAAGLRQLERYPTTDMVVTDAGWVGDREVTRCPVGTTAVLWEGCHLSVLSEGWWLLQVGGEMVGICTDATVPCPVSDILCIYVGGAPQLPPGDTPYVVACSQTWLRRNRPVLTGQVTLITDNSITLTPSRGEWRILPWL